MALTKEEICDTLEVCAELKERGQNFVTSPDYIGDLCRLALLGLERDERAERVGRAVMSFIDGNFDGVRHARVYAKYLEDSQFHTAADFFRAIADAMEEP